MTKRLQDLHEEFQAAVNDYTTCLYYGRVSRWARIAMVQLSLEVDVNIDDSLYSVGGWTIDYCPWSGKLLPGELDPVRCKVLAEEFGISTPQAYWVDVAVPEEFNSEEWFVKRQIDRRRRPDCSPKRWHQAEHPVKNRHYFDEEPPPGLWRAHETPPHLCEQLGRMFNDVRTMITYIPWTREYGIRKILNPRRWIDMEPIAMRRINYCPCCGTELPSSLKAAWYEAMAAEGVDPNDLEVPAKFLSDTWWKEAGL